MRILLSLSLVLILNSLSFSTGLKGQLFARLKYGQDTSISFNKRFNSLPLNDELRRSYQEFLVSRVHCPFILDDIHLRRTYLIEYDSNIPSKRIIHGLELLNIFDYVEEVPDYQFFLNPNDKHPNQWALNKISAPLAWDVVTGSASVVIALVDDAVLLNHQDISPIIWINPAEISGNGIDDDANGYIDDVNGWDAADNDNNPNPPSSASNTYFTHGTHCAGIAAAATNNNLGIASISYNVKLLPVKIGANATSSLTGAYLGVQYAIKAKAQVISMSWGGGGYSSTYQTLFNYANSQNIVLVAASGNSNSPVPMYPAAYNHVISVASTDSTDIKSSFSNYGYSIDLCAPGRSIYSTLAGSTSSYGYLSGTSMACPMVAGLAALLISKSPYASAAQIETCLKSTCDDISSINPLYYNLLGAGRINAFAAVKCLKPLNALFSQNKHYACIGDTIKYKDESILNPISWRWTFQGGSPSSSTARNPSVVYSTNGKYNVTLIVTSTWGSDTLTKSQIIEIGTPTVLMNGTALIKRGYFANLRFIFKGSPPYSFVLTHSSGTDTLRNLTEPIYYHSVSPWNSSTYSVSNYIANGCAGITSGTATITVDTLSYNCRRSIKSSQKVSDTNGNFSGVLSNNDIFGTSLAALGDLNRDSIPDLAAGQIYADDGGTDRGAIHILFMNRDGSVKSRQKISSTTGGFTGTIRNSALFGTGLGSIGDIDGDTINDIVVGGILDGPGSEGAVWILRMNSNGTVKGSTKIEEGTSNFSSALDPGDLLGIANGIGDLDSDGIPDLAIGAVGDDDGGADRGAIYVVFLNTNGTVKGFQKISSTVGGFSGALDNGDQFGSSITQIGDMDGDGRKEIAVGALYDDDGGTDRGCVYVLYLNANGTVKRYKKLSSTSGNIPQILNSGGFGRSVEYTGDVDHNGSNDLLVGAYSENVGGTAKGAAYLLFLDTSYSVISFFKVCDTTQNFSSKLDANDYFGKSIAFCGFLNEDSHPDFAVGAYNDDDGGSNRGAFYVIFQKDSCIGSYDTTKKPNCKLKADFEYSLINCINDSVKFKDISKEGSNRKIVGWNWYFNEATIPKSGSPSMSYLFPGADTFNVKLVVFNDSTPSCRDSVIKKIIVRNSPAVIIYDDTTICRGDSAILGAKVLKCLPDNINFSWEPSIGVADTSMPFTKVKTSKSGWFKLNIKQGQTVIGSDSMFINVDSNCCKSYAEFELEKNSICIGDSIDPINRSLSTALPASYTWEFGPHASISSFSGFKPGKITFSVPGEYNIQLVLNDNCGTDTFIIPLLVYPYPDQIASDTLIRCYAPVQLTGEHLNTLKYTWSPQLDIDDIHSAYPIFNNITHLSYFVIIEDEYTKCKTLDSIFVYSMQYHKILPSSDTILCLGDTLPLLLDPPAHRYKWSNGDTTRYSSVKYEGMLKVNYHIVGCMGSDSIKITNQSYPKIELGADTALCSGDSISYSIQDSNYIFLWHDNSSNNKKTIKNTELVKVTVVSQAGCTSKDSVKVNFLTPPKVNLGTDTILCDNNSVVLDAKNTGDQFLWNDGDTSQLKTVYVSGQYSVRVRNYANCEDADTITISTSLTPLVTIEGHDTIKSCDKKEIILFANNPTNSSLQWLDGNTSSIHSVSESGTYIIKAFSPCGTTYDTTVVNYLDCICNIYIPNSFSPNSDKINPTFKLSVCAPLIYQLDIFNLWGEKVFHSGDPTIDWDGTYQNEACMPGVYYYSLRVKYYDYPERKINGTINLIR